MNTLQQHEEFWQEKHRLSLGRQLSLQLRDTGGGLWVATDDGDDAFRLNADDLTVITDDPDPASSRRTIRVLPSSDYMLVFGGVAG